MTRAPYTRLTFNCVPALAVRTISSYSSHSQADPQDFEQLLMVEPLLTVRDFRTELEEADAGELLRNYEFNISQGIVQRVSRFFDALALMDERGEAPPAREEGGKYAADSARGGVMGFGRKQNVCNQERHPARRVTWEQQEAEEAVSAAARKAAEQGAEVAALEAKVAEMQALATPSLQLCALSHPRHTFGAPSAPSAHSAPLRSRSAPSAPSAVFTSAHSMQSVPSSPLHHLRLPQELAAPKGWFS
jgi:hypothetical protein